MKKRNRILAGILAALLTFSLAGCGGQGTAGNTAGTAGTAEDASQVQEENNGTTANADGITIAVSSDITTLDPQNASGTVTATVFFNMFDCLTRMDAEGNVECLLAESYENLDDTTWQFKLRQGVTFTNGEVFNADTVKYSVERILDENYGSSVMADFADIDGVEVVDDYTVNIITKTPFPSLPLRLTYLAMVPKDYITENGDDYFAANPVGTGAYKLDSYEEGNQLVLTANEDYFMGAPEVKKVTFKIIKEESTRVMAVQAGEVDIAMSIPVSQIGAIDATEGYSIIAGPADRTMFLGMNTIGNEALSKKEVRQAICYAIDMDTIISVILGGYADKTAALSLPQWSGYDASVTPYEYDPEKAKQMLADAGYASGLSLEIAVVNGEYPCFSEIAEAIAGQLQSVGIDAYVNYYEKSVLRGAVKDNSIPALYLMGLGGPYAENNQTLRIICGTGERYSTWSNEKFDTLRAEAGSEFDETKRNELWSQIQSLIKEEAPVASLYQLYGVYAVRDNLDWTPALNEVIQVNEISYK